jgi:imidazolonepropionase-like amidohydrolase
MSRGTDSGVGPHGHNARELGLLVEHGMTPMQAIVASTSEAAKLLHLDKEIGTLEEGKLADLLLVDSDLLDNITAIEDKGKLALIMKAGQIVKQQREASNPSVTTRD